MTGAGFVTLAATLSVVPGIPIESLAILVGIDRFMSECRALTNLVGNGVATVVVSRWEKEVTPELISTGIAGLDDDRVAFEDIVLHRCCLYSAGTVRSSGAAAMRGCSATSTGASPRTVRQTL